MTDITRLANELADEKIAEAEAATGYTFTPAERDEVRAAARAALDRAEDILREPPETT